MAKKKVQRDERVRHYLKFTYSEMMTAARHICEKIADGNCRALKDILAAPPPTIKYPQMGTLLKWVQEYPEVRALFFAAREAQVEYMADELIRIADTCTDATKARLQIDTRKFLMAKFMPHKFGEAVDRLGMMASVAGAGGMALKISFVENDPPASGDVVQGGSIKKTIEAECTPVHDDTWENGGMDA